MTPVISAGDLVERAKPRIKKYGCFWVVLTLQSSGAWKGEWTYDHCHRTLDEALRFTASRVLAVLNQDGGKP